MTEITRHEAREAARLIAQYRSRCAGEPWDRPGIEDALATARHRADIADLVRAGLRAAAIPTNRTPAVIALDGDHWRGHESAAPRARRVAPTDRCSICDAPLDDHQLHDHQPVRNVAPVVNQRQLASRLAAMRESIGDAKAQHEPAPAREPLPSLPQVDRLRELVHTTHTDAEEHSA